MAYDITNSWRGVVGTVKPTHRPGSLEEFIRFLPEGIGVIPVTLGIKEGTEKEFLASLEPMKEKVAELAKLKVDLIFPQGAPPFMVRGYRGEEAIVKSWEEEFGIPVVTVGMTQVEALRVLGVKKMIGITYFPGDLNKTFAQYFTDAGFEVLAMEGIPIAFSEAGRLTYQEVYAFCKKLFLQHKDAQGIYMLGGAWRILEVIQLLEQDLRIPVVHSTPAKVWAIEKRLYVRQPMKGYGRLLEEMP